MRKLCLLIQLISAVLLQLHIAKAQRPCTENTLDNAIRNFIGREYQSDVERTQGRDEIDTDNIDLFASCVARRKQYGLPDREYGIDRAVVSFNIADDYNSNSGDAGYTGRLDVQCWRGQWLLTRSYSEPYLREAEGVCAQCDSTATNPCRPCLLSCESNEIPLDDCTDCGTMKTQLHTFSKPAWKDHIPASTDSTKSPDVQTQLYTELVGTTNVVTHAANPGSDQVSSDSGIETYNPETHAYTTQTVPPSTDSVTDSGSDSGVKEKKFTTVVLPTASTSQENKITTKSVDSTDDNGTDTPTVYGTGMISPLYTGTFEVDMTTESPTEGVETKAAPTTTESADIVTEIVTTKADLVTTKVITTKGDVVTTKVAAETTESAVETTEADVTTTEGMIVTTKHEVVTTKADLATTEGEVVTTNSDVVTTEDATTEGIVVETSDYPTTEGVAVVTDLGAGDTGDIGDSDEEDTEEDNDEDIGGDFDDNGVDDEMDTINADPEFCLDHDTCYNGGESVCEKNGGDFLYCICQTGFTGTYCEQIRSVAKVDVSDTRSQAGFWDWKLSKYIIGGLGALTVIGLIMLTCMVVKCVRSGKEDRRRMKDYNSVGLETFIPPAPVVPGTLTAAALDRGSSDVMDERSEEEFPLHDSDTELGDGPAVHVHRRHHHYPDPEDDGLLHHAPSHRPAHSPDAPSHRPAHSPDHYKVPTPNQHREYMNMNGKNGKQNGKNGISPYMNGHHIDQECKHSPYMNGNNNTYSHKLADKGCDVQYAHLNRSFSKNTHPVQQHQYLNLP